MPRRRPEGEAPGSEAKSKGNGNSQRGFEADLFKAADKLRGTMEPSDYKHVALGLIFLKYISGAFEAKRAIRRKTGARCRLVSSSS